MDNKELFNKMVLNKRFNLVNKNNCFFPETPSIDKLTFRENENDFKKNENKENLSDLINRTIKLKEKTISNSTNLLSNSSNSDKLEKSTPGFNKYQKKLDTQDLFVHREKAPSPAKKCPPPEKIHENSTSVRLKKNKKTSSCLWESSNLSFDQVHNISIESNKDFFKRSELKNSTNLNLSTNTNTTSTMARKLKLPANHFWKKFIGKSALVGQKLGKAKDEKESILEEMKHFKSKEYEEKDEISWMKRELLNLKERVETLESNEKGLKETTEKLKKKYKKLKKEKENLKKINSYLIDQNKGILIDLKEVSAKSNNNKSFETVLKSLNEFEVRLKNSIVCSNKLIISSDV